MHSIRDLLRDCLFQGSRASKWLPKTACPTYGIGTHLDTERGQMDCWRRGLGEHLSRTPSQEPAATCLIASQATQVGIRTAPCRSRSYRSCSLMTITDMKSNQILTLPSAHRRTLIRVIRNILLLSAERIDDIDPAIGDHPQLKHFES